MKTVPVFLDTDIGGDIDDTWALAYLLNSPELELELLVGKDLRDGKLKGLDLLVVPGGSSEMQYASMQEAGAEAVRKFVASGGSYFGVCAGFHCALYKPRRIGLLPFTHLKHGYGLQAPLVVELSERGAKVLDIPKGRYTVTYSEGPVAIPCEQPGEGWGEQLAVYLNSVSTPKRPKFNFSGTPAIIHGEYGKGKVIATSFHPEMRPPTYPIAFGCIYAVTGVKTKAVFPAKDKRPLRVGFSPVGMCKRKVRNFLEFERQPDMDINLVLVGDGTLEHIDVLVMSEGKAEPVRDFFKSPRYCELVTEFLERGGKMVVSESFAEIVPQHRNVVTVPVGGSFVDAVRKACD